MFWKFREGVHAKVEGMPNKPTSYTDENPIILLENIKTFMFNFNSFKYSLHATHKCKSNKYLVVVLQRLVTFC